MSASSSPPPSTPAWSPIPSPSGKSSKSACALLPQFDPNVLKLKRIYVAAATECPIDKQGRVMIPPELREYAGLQKDVIFAGMVKTIELWSKDRWQENARLSREEATDVARALAGLGL